MLSDRLQKEIVEKIVAAVHPAKIILFGSHAYGQPEEESDLDLVIIKDKPVYKFQEMREIRKALTGIDLPKDIIVCDEEYFMAHSTTNWINTALFDAATRGIVLYEKTRH